MTATLPAEVPATTEPDAGGGSDACTAGLTGGVLAGLCTGRTRWDLVSAFPAQDETDRRTGDAAEGAMRAFLTRYVDPDAVDRAGALPVGLLDRLRRAGYLALRMPPGLGGLGLSFANAFRVITVAMGWSVPVGWCLAIQNGLGAGAYLRLLPDGPLADLIRAHVAAGSVFGDADTEPAGAANEGRTTTATPTADQTAYELTGEKICIGNGPVADLLAVSATVRDADGERVEYFFVDTATPGFTIRSAQHFLGLRGASIGALDFDRVRVPREHLLVLPGDVDTEYEVNRPARLYLVTAPAIALSRRCAEWSREFVRRRAVDGRPLGDYDEIRRNVVATLADGYAIETVAQWCLLAGDRMAAEDFRIEQSAAKNITAAACWRAVDRTVSLLGAEGLETAASKDVRGTTPSPAERAFRDARALRVAGGVDFLLDKYFGTTVVLDRIRTDPTIPGPDRVSHRPAVLSARNQRHAAWLDAAVATFPARCRHLIAAARCVREVDGWAGLPDRVPIFVNQIANELFTLTLCLGRAAASVGGAAPGPDPQDLADVYATAARLRIADWWRRAADADEPDVAAIAGPWLDGRP